MSGKKLLLLLLLLLLLDESCGGGGDGGGVVLQLLLVALQEPDALRDAVVVDGHGAVRCGAGSLLGWLGVISEEQEKKKKPRKVLISAVG